MARKKIIRTLPPLPRFPGLRAGDHKEERLLETLRRVAVTSQKAEAQAFYSLREMTEHFHVPISTGSRIYSRLEKEGILSRIRGSRTLLQGKGAARQLSVQGLVGMPASTSCLMTLQDYRTFFMRTRRELRLRGFVSETLNFEKHELRDGKLSERLKRYQVDTVIWFMPELSSRDTAARLRDAGVRVIGVSDGGMPGIPCRFEVRREIARRQILQGWGLSGEVEKVLILSVPYRRSSADEERLQALMEEEGCAFELVSLSTQRPELLLQSASSNRHFSAVLRRFALIVPRSGTSD